MTSLPDNAPLRTCPEGHRWQSDAEGGACPVCSAANGSVAAGDLSAKEEASLAADAALDALPPPPRPLPSYVQAPITWTQHAARTMPVARGAHAAPEIPGYELFDEVGRGGMGVVYRARHVRLNRLVALKMILAGPHAEPRLLERFRTEAEAVARLQHPNIVRIYEVGEQAGLPYVAFEFVEGESLARRLAGAPLSPRQAAELIETLARAAHHAHERGVVHRDLKPANVLLEDGGSAPSASTPPASAPAAATLVPKIADFGVAKRIDDDSGHTRTGEVMGTPSYMAPEQAAGASRSQPVGPAADVYALGAILYECLTGRPPFRAATALETLRQVREEGPVSPSRLQTKTPRDLTTICLKCLEKPPAKRYASAAALADDLRRFLDGRPIAARPVGRLERGWRWCRRHPASAALIGLLLLCVTAGVVVAWNVADSRREAEFARRERQTKATAQAQRALAEADEAWRNAQAAPDGELLAWMQAEAVARKAAELSAAGDVEPLTRAKAKATLDSIAKDLRTLRALEDLRLSQFRHDQETVVDDGVLDAQYARVLRDYGIDAARPQQAPAVIGDSAIRSVLVAALEEWMLCRPARPDREALAALLAAVDPNPHRQPLRQALVEKDPDVLWLLAKLDTSSLTPAGAVYLAGMLQRKRALDEAEAVLRAVQRRHPGDFQVNFVLAHLLMQVNPPRWEEAVRYYTAAVAVRPDSPRAHYSLGLALHKLWRLFEAVDECRRAVELRDDYAEAHNALGLALLDLGHLDEAEEHCRRALQLKPGHSWAHNNLGLILDYRGQPQAAIAQHRLALDNDPQLMNAHYNLARALFSRGQFQESLALFERSLALMSPRDPYAEQCRARIDKSRRALELNARLDALLAGTDEPADADERLALAEVCLCRELPAAAARFYAESFAADPKLAEIVVGSPRLQAAKAAVLAGTGQGRDELAPDELARAKLRAQAMSWLRADHAALHKRLQSGETERDRLDAYWRLQIRRYDVAFDAVREQEPLSKLPAVEQAAWQQLWTDALAPLMSQQTRR